MRDIRSDLEERANVVQEQIRSSHAHFENAVRQLQQERDARIADLSETLANQKAHAIRVRRHGQSGDVGESATLAR